MKEKICVIGAGSWGTTLAIMLAKKGLDTSLHSVFHDHNLKMIEHKENRDFLPQAKFPPALKIIPTLDKALQGNIIIVAIPVKYIRRALLPIQKKKINFKGKIFVNVSKGIESESLKRVSQIIVEGLGRVDLAVLSGPNIAKEVLSGVPSTAVIAAHDQKIARRLQKIFTTPRFRVYTHTDVVGVELCGALKNIIAIACGISDGLGFGANTKAALLTRGLVEITRLGKKLGAHTQTFWGVSGLGDLATTCFSSHSRNRFVGEEIGKGKSLKEILGSMAMVAEGIETTRSAYLLAQKLKVDMPITKEVYNIIYKNKPLKKAVDDLMRRGLKPESVE